MSLPSQSVEAIPPEPARVAQAACPHRTRFMPMRDALGTIDDHPAFAALYPQCGKPAAAPWRLARITGMPCAGDVSERAAATAVRSRIDWQYAVSFERTDPGLPYAVCATFRTRLVTGQAEPVLLEAMLERVPERGLLNAGGRARTDSPPGLAAGRAGKRLACVGETLRAARTDLAVGAPAWLRQPITAAWLERYGKRCEASRLPQGDATRYAYAAQLGMDGFHRRSAIYRGTAPGWIRAVPTVAILRQTWGYHYSTDEEGRLRWRTAQNLPPAGRRLDSPYAPDAPFGHKRSVTWTGDKVHLTETCDDKTLHVMTHVETTAAAVTAVTMTAPSHPARADKQLTPETHMVAAGDGDATLLVERPRDFPRALIGPVRPNISWQAKHEQAYAIRQCHIDWEAQQVTCPRGKPSAAWSLRHDRWQHPGMRVTFATKAWRACEGRPLCTKAKTAPRPMT